MSIENNPPGERCVRCGEVGEDRRTLHMACFYEMEELGLPFETEILFNGDHELMRKAKDPFMLDLKNGTKITLAAGTVTTTGELTPHRQYTLRVCKACRADWLSVIKEWFYAAKTPEGDGDIPIRENGAMRMISRVEWDRRMRQGKS